ncbi:MAG: hypothetical protein ABGZ17_28225 [Planctomycetaceae bacterium]
MAIQFNCPVCTAQIRVPDAVAGKRGKCPQCATLIAIPQVERPDVQASAVTLLDASPASRAASPPAEFETGTQPIQSSDISAFDEPKFEVPQSLMASKVKQRQRRMSVSVVAPLIFGALLILVVLYWFREPTKSLEGELTAVMLNADPLEPRIVPKSTVAVSAEILDFVLADLEREPQLLKSPGSMNVEIAGTPQGLAIQVFEVPKKQFFAVDLSTDEVLRGYIAEHAKALEESRSDVLRAAAVRFFKDWYQTRQRDPRAIVKDLLNYRNEIGLSTLVGGFGFHVEAEIGGNRYRCVYEDDERRLYFLLPSDTRKFTLLGRKVAGSRVEFPGSYRVRVTVPQTAPQDEQEAADTEDAPAMNEN